MRILWTRYRNELIFLIATTICLDNWTCKVNLLNSKRSFRSENEQHCLNFTCIGNCLGVTRAGLSLKTFNLSSNLGFFLYREPQIRGYFFQFNVSLKIKISFTESRPYLTLSAVSVIKMSYWGQAAHIFLF